jgi:hypothetical protein
MPAGRPPKYASPEDMQRDIDAYFAQCNAENPPLISGLAYHLDMTTESLRRYRDNDQFSAVVKKARQRVEMAVEMRLHGNSPTGAIFWLKNNADYRDKHESEVSGPNGGPIQVSRIELVAIDGR